MILKYLYSYFISLKVNRTSGFFPILCNSLRVILKIRKYPDAQIIVNGQLTVNRQDKTFSTIKIILYKNAKLIINGNVHLHGDTTITVLENATLILGSNNEKGVSTQSNFRVTAAKLIEIGSGCMISWDVFLTDNSSHKIGNPPEFKVQPVKINENVWINAKSMILKGIEIGEGAIIGAGSIVTKSVPPKTLVAGIPAKVVSKDVYWHE